MTRSLLRMSFESLSFVSPSIAHYMLASPIVYYIVLKHVTWRFRICNYFREMLKLRDFMDTLRNFTKFVFAHIFAKFKYFAKLFILKTTCFKMIYNMFIF